MSAAPELAGEVEVCPNCGNRRTGRFCSTCGQRDVPIAPTLKFFLDELMNDVLNVDGKIFRSLRLLITRPGFLTSEIFLGRRASYESPLRLYLLMSILAFVFGATFGGFDAVNIQYTADPGEVVDPAIVERAAQTERTITEAVYVWLPRAMFVLVPLFAALVMLLRRGTGHTYPQHLYFALHVHAAWFFANALDSLSEPIRVPYVATIVDIVTELYMVAYLPIAFWYTYRTTVPSAIWRSAIIALLYFLALMVTLIGIAAPFAAPFLFGRAP